MQPTQAPLVGVATPDPLGRCDHKREEFLLELYRQTSGHMGRHISGVWQCVGVVGAALIVFAQDKSTSLNDYSCTLVVLLCGWLAATTLDASNWFNRNLRIITNLERLFLTSRDLTLVHYFFGKHRKAGGHAQHFGIQLFLSGAVGLLVLAYHFSERVRPLSALTAPQFDWPRPLPYLTAVVVLLALSWLASHFRTKDAEFKVKSPGITLENTA
jgi:hypothetical protein